MYNNLLLSLALSAVPLLALTFVVALLLHKVYVQIRSRFAIKVNCWFCNQNTKVPYADANSWTCPLCEQYNGFTKDGDYNREIYQQLDCSNLSSSSRRHSDVGQVTPPNGLCNVCNEAQRLKVEKLAQFEPKNESHFDAELKVYKSQLEEQFGLCASCDRHLKKVLHEKKKMVLGSKFLDYLLRGHVAMKQPHFTQLRDQQQQLWKRRLSLCLTLCAVVNVYCLCTRLSLPQLTLEGISAYCGQIIAQPVFIAGSHLVTLLRVLGTYLEAFASYDVVIKVRLFCRTVFFMLMYSLGLKLPQILRVDFVTMFLLASPYTVLVLAFGHNIVDGFRLTRYTFLLGMWGILAGNLIVESILSQQVLMFVASLATFCLSVTSHGYDSTTATLQNTKSQSFHRIYSEDYLSEYDEDTLSLISQQLQSSTTSQRSTRSNAWNSTTCFDKSMHIASPRVLATTPPRSTVSPNVSFQSYLRHNNNHNHNNNINNWQMTSGPNSLSTPMYSPYASSERCFGTGTQSPYQMHGTPFGASAAAPGFNFQVPRGVSQYNDATLLQTAKAPAPMRSPTGISASNIYQPHLSQTRAANTQLLSPSRFSTTSSPQSTHTAWLTSGAYFNPPVQQRTTVGSVLYEARGMEDHSRSSSHSSGFESQSNERVYVPREQSCGRESALGEIDAGFKAFQPIEQSAARSSTRLPDCFNLQQIDDQLPGYHRGDLLRKWKETQSIS